MILSDVITLWLVYLSSGFVRECVYGCIILVMVIIRSLSLSLIIGCFFLEHRNRHLVVWMYFCGVLAYDLTCCCQGLLLLTFIPGTASIESNVTPNKINDRNVDRLIYSSVFCSVLCFLIHSVQHSTSSWRRLFASSITMIRNLYMVYVAFPYLTTWFVSSSSSFCVFRIYLQSFL